MPVIDEDGKTLKRLVSKSAIPWYKDFKSVKAYRCVLEEELDAFWEFTEKKWVVERAERMEIVNVIQSVLQDAGLQVQVLLDGAAGVSVDIPGGCCSVCVVGQDETQTFQMKILEVLQDNGWWVEAGDVITVRNGEGQSTAMAFKNVGYLTLRRHMQRLGNMSVHLKKTVKVLGQVLRQSNLLSEQNGGVSEFSLLVMTASALATLPQDGNPVHHVLQTYGKGFHAETCAASVTGTIAGGAAMGGIFVQSPVDAAVNLAATCRRFIQIRELCNYCHMMLAKWDSPARNPSGSRKPYSYKGKSPLSSVIAFKNVPQKDKAQVKNLPPQPVHSRIPSPPPPPAPPAPLSESDDELPPLVDEPTTSPPLQTICSSSTPAQAPCHAFLFARDTTGSIWGTGQSRGW